MNGITIGADRAGGGAVERERRQPVRLEEAQQEANREIRRHRRAERADESLAPHPVALVSEELRQLENRGGADDRRGEQEGETGGVLVGEPDEEAAAHRRTGAGEPRDQRQGLRRADPEGLREPHLLRDADVVVRSVCGARRRSSSAP